jgi:hypothetical protein
MTANWCYGNPGCRCDACRVAKPYGTAECIDCGKVSERILHAGIPHICQRCLFPPSQPDPREMVTVLVTRVRGGRSLEVQS